jgi:hypothetical protein
MLSRLNDLQAAQIKRDEVRANYAAADDPCPTNEEEPADPSCEPPTAAELDEKRKELQMLEIAANSALCRANGWHAPAIYQCFKQACMLACWESVYALLQYDCLLAAAHVKECEAVLCRMEFACIGATREDLMQCAVDECGDPAMWPEAIAFYLSSVIGNPS